MRGLTKLPADLSRLWQISRTFLAIGGALFSRWLLLHIAIPTVRLISPERAGRMQIPEINLPERIRLAFEELGATFVKLGQVLSVRPDIVPPEYVAEFEKLQSRVPPFPYEEVRKVIVAEFGQPPESMFKSFDSTPIAAASIAQVHYAVLPSGDRLAVKAQRPGIRNDRGRY